MCVTQNNISYAIRDAKRHLENQPVKYSLTLDNDVGHHLEKIELSFAHQTPAVPRQLPLALGCWPLKLLF